ncbi:hypothetical protein U8V72_21245 [Priestia filamentosa]
MTTDYEKQMEKLKLKQEIRNNELKKFLYTLKAALLTEEKF